MISILQALYAMQQDYAKFIKPSHRSCRELQFLVNLVLLVLGTCVVSCTTSASAPTDVPWTRRQYKTPGATRSRAYRTGSLYYLATRFVRSQSIELLIMENRNTDQMEFQGPHQLPQIKRRITLPPMNPLVPRNVKQKTPFAVYI